MIFSDCMRLLRARKSIQTNLGFSLVPIPLRKIKLRPWTFLGQCKILDIISILVFPQNQELMLCKPTVGFLGSNLLGLDLTWAHNLLVWWVRVSCFR